VRNLPKREFYENELKALIIKLLQAFNDEKKKNDHSFKELRAKAVIKQVKVLRDQEKQSLDEQSG
jgi:hypothetical protein